jgi:serine phosphatase RsbU (regulator of sigma subunit)
MHPILGHRGRLLLYLALWLPVGGALGYLLRQDADLSWTKAMMLGVPLAFFLAFFCLAAWYPAKSRPRSSAQLWQALVSHGAAALLSTALWQLLGGGWATLLENGRLLPNANALLQGQAPALILFGLLFYSLAAAAFHLYLAFEASQEAERQAVAAQQRQALAEQEVELARLLQRRLLPAPEADGETWLLAARNLAARGVAGDFYDYFRGDSGTLYLAVADVAGKGLAASLIMATVKALLPYIATGRGVVDTLGELNARLCDQLGAREFVSLALASFDPASGRLELANAGLPDPYLLRAGQPPLPLEAPQPRLPLGLRRGLAYVAVEATLEPGDRLLLLTDGLPEAPVEGEPLGYQRLPRYFDHPMAPVKAGAAASVAGGVWLDTLIVRLRQVSKGDLEDDWTTLLLERKA